MQNQALEDITNDCRYLVDICYDGHILYNIQAEEKTCWRTVGLYKKKRLKTFNESDYVVKQKKGVVKVYRRGGMKYG